MLTQCLWITLNKEVFNLNSKISSVSEFIPATIIKQSIDVHLQNLTNAVNHTLQNNFREESKQAKVIPVYKKITIQ